eukprot:1308583-Pyramimonas_sp.AAC.1
MLEALRRKCACGRPRKLRPNLNSTAVVCGAATNGDADGDHSQAEYFSTQCVPQRNRGKGFSMQQSRMSVVRACIGVCRPGRRIYVILRNLGGAIRVRNAPPAARIL